MAPAFDSNRAAVSAQSPLRRAPPNPERPRWFKTSSTPARQTRRAEDRNPAKERPNPQNGRSARIKPARAKTETPPLLEKPPEKPELRKTEEKRNKNNHKKSKERRTKKEKEKGRGSGQESTPIGAVSPQATAAGSEPGQAGAPTGPPIPRGLPAARGAAPAKTAASAAKASARAPAAGPGRRPA